MDLSVNSLRIILQAFLQGLFSSSVGRRCKSKYTHIILSIRRMASTAWIWLCKSSLLSWSAIWETPERIIPAAKVPGLTVVRRSLLNTSSLLLNNDRYFEEFGILSFLQALVNLRILWDKRIIFLFNSNISPTFDWLIIDNVAQILIDWSHTVIIGNGPKNIKQMSKLELLKYVKRKWKTLRQITKTNEKLRLKLTHNH